MSKKEIQPKKSQSPEHNIYRALRLNRTIVYAVIVAAVIVCLGAMYFNYQTYQYNMNHALVLTAEGEKIPLEFVEKARVIFPLAAQHLTNWFSSYYTFDQNSMPDKREQGLWLISKEDGQQLEKFYTDQGWFNDIVRKSLKQTTTIIPGTLEIVGYQEPYSFRCTVEIIVHPLSQPKIKDVYHMAVLGLLSEVDSSWPENSQGFIIHNYRESPWTKVEEE